jgi:hypothetical protein
MKLRVFDVAATLSERRLFEDRGACFGPLVVTLNHRQRVTLSR